MINNTFYIVARSKSVDSWRIGGRGDKWGWELVDGIEITDYAEAIRLRLEYAASMPDHTVLIRPVRTKTGEAASND